MSNQAGAGFWRCGKCGTPNPAAGYITSCVACGTSRALAAAPPRPEAKAEPRPAEATRRRETRSERGRIGLGATILFGLSILYGMVVLGLVGLIRLGGDDSWFAGLLMLGPRAVAFLPLLVLAAFSIRARRKRIWAAQGVAFLLILFPLMGFNLPIANLLLGDIPADATMIRVMSLNRGGVKLDVGRLVQFVELHKMDAICFQEPGMVKDLALDEYFANGWYREKDGYVVSRHPIVEEIPPPPERNADLERYTMSVRRVKVKHPSGAVYQVASVHMPTMTRGLSGAREKGFDPGRFRLHLQWWSEEFGRLVETLETRRDAPLIAAGDLNMPSDHPLVAAFRNGGLYRFAFEERGWGFGHTKPPNYPWIRIDHVFTGPEWSISRCWIGPSFGSDHRSIVAETALPAGQTTR